MLQRVEGAKVLAAGLRGQLLDKEKELLAAHERMGEQLVLLQTAFNRRDITVKLNKELQDQLVCMYGGGGHRQAK